nr:pollen-specific leucine-rich repeat extensin-like protein 2 [Drosophila kikkawai]
MSSTISSPRDDAWMGLALEELLDGLQMGYRPQPSLLAPLRVAGGRRQILSAEQLDVPPDHRFGPIRVDTTPPRPRPIEAAHTPADQGKQPLTDQGPPPLVPLRTTRAPSTQATQGQAPGGKPPPREAPHTSRLSTTPTGNQGQPPQAAPRAARPSTRPHTGRVATTTTGHETPSSRATPRAALTSARSRTGPTPTTPGTRAVQDPDGEVEAALRECLGDLPPDVLEEMAHGAEGLDMEDLFGESPDEDGVQIPTRPASDQSVDEPRTPSPQFLPDYEEISSDEGEADGIIQISDSDDAEPNVRPPGTTPPSGRVHTPPAADNHLRGLITEPITADNVTRIPRRRRSTPGRGAIDKPTHRLDNRRGLRRREASRGRTEPPPATNTRRIRRCSGSTQGGGPERRAGLVLRRAGSANQPGATFGQGPTTHTSTGTPRPPTERALGGQ